MPTDKYKKNLLLNTNVNSNRPWGDWNSSFNCRNERQTNGQPQLSVFNSWIRGL